MEKLFEALSLSTAHRTRYISRAKLAERTHSLADLARQEEAPLARCGWPVRKRSALEAAVARLEKSRSAQVVAREESRRALEDVKARATEAAAGRSELIAALRLLVAQKKCRAEPGLLKIGPAPWSARHILDWMALAADTVENAADALAEVMHEDPVRKLESLKARLAASVAVHEATRRALPVASATVRRAADDLMAGIDELLVTARFAFHRKPETLKQFHKGLRPRRRKPVAPLSAGPSA